MKVSTQSTGPREVELTIELEQDFVNQAMRRAAQRVSRYRPLAGFRPGRAPYELVERSYGRELLLNEALEAEADHIYHEAVEAAQIEPYRPGQFSIAQQEPVTLKTRVALMPEVTLGDYRAVRVDAQPEVVLAEEELERAIEGVRRRHAQVETVERPLQMGDEALVVLEGRAGDEVVIESHSANLVMDDELKPAGFAEAVLGMQPKEQREFALTYAPDDEDARVAGKQVAFRVTLDAVHQVQLPALDDELAKTDSRWDTLEALRAGLAEQLKANHERANRSQEAEAAVERLIELSQFEYPDALLNGELDAALSSRRQRVQQAGLEWQAYLRMNEQTESQLREQLQPDVMRQIVRRLMLGKLAEVEKIELTEKEMEDAQRSFWMELYLSYGQRASEVAREMVSRGALGSVMAEARTEKAALHLADLATGRVAPKEIEQPSAEQAADEDSSAEDASPADAAAPSAQA